MKLILLTLACAVLIGFALGGRWSNLARVRVRWPAVAMLGLALQLAPVRGRAWAMGMLYVSFALLIAFAVVNLRARVPGFTAILLGMLLNLVVIGVNGGMPVTQQALVASRQTDTLMELVQHGGVKHHLAGPDDRLLFLGDSIAIAPLRQAMSLGDLFAYGGVMWLIVAGMLGRGPVRGEEQSPAGRPREARGVV